MRMEAGSSGADWGGSGAGLGGVGGRWRVG